MIRTPACVLVFGAAFVLGAVGACSSNSGPTKSGGTGEPEPDGGITVVPIGDGGAKVDSGGSDAASASDAGDPLGSLTVTDVADVDCQAPGGQAAEVTPALQNGPLYDVLGAVASRRFAVSSDGLSFLTFANGGGPSTPVDDVIGAAGEGSVVAALLKSGTGISLQRYDDVGAASGGSVTVTASNDWQAIASNGAKTLVVWSQGAALSGALFAAGGTSPQAVDLGADAAGAGTYLIRAVPSGTGFVVVWTRTRTDKKIESLWRRVEGDGTLSATQSLIVSTGDHGVTGLAPLPNGGAALLVNEALPAKDVVVMRVDAQGAFVSPAFRLVGSGRGFGIAANASGELGVVATHGNRSAFRALAGDGTALGPWYCIDDNADGGASFYPQSAIDADDAGFAHLTRALNGAAILRRVDHTGAGL